MVLDNRKDLLNVVKRFAIEVMRPAGQRLDKLPDPKDAIAPSSELWDVFKKYKEIGIDFFNLYELTQNLKEQAELRAEILELLGWGDAGLAISLSVSYFPRMLAMLSGDPELIEKYGRGDAIGCWPITEPDHGSDILIYGGRLKEMPGRPNCIAVKHKDSFVIKGQKSAWVSNGTIAEVAALFCAVDLGDGIAGMGGFLVPLDLPGVSRGKPLDKIGQRALNQGEIYFDDVRVPEKFLIIKPGNELGDPDIGLAQANSTMGAVFVGLAQAAFDYALEYAHNRIQGGVPIFNHQNVKLRLFEMFKKLEAARSLSRRAILENSTLAPNAPLAIAAKVNATTTAFELASEAIQIFGGNGLSKEYPVEKLLRDARASMIEDGSNDVLGILAAEKFMQKKD